MPSSASLRITPSTSPTSSGSSAEVGSFEQDRLGLHRQRAAMATRCCWPPKAAPVGLGLVGEANLRQQGGGRAQTPGHRGSFFTWIGPSDDVSRCCAVWKQIEALEYHRHLGSDRTIDGALLSTRAPSTTMSPAS